MALYKGSTKVGDLYKGQIKVSDLYKGDNLIYIGEPPISANTLRFKFGDSSYDPNVAGIAPSGTWTKRNEFEDNVWDWTNNNTSWATAFGSGNNQTPGAFGDIDNNPVILMGSGDNSSVTNMSRLFQACYGLKKVCSIDTSGATNVLLMFTYCTNVSYIGDLDFSKATDTRAVFQCCFSLLNAPWIDFPTDHSFSMENLFLNCISIKTIPLYNTTQCTNMKMLFGCNENATGISHLESVPLLDTRNVTIMQYMFQRCASLRSIPQFNTSKVTNMGAMFTRCASLTDVSLLDTSSVTTMSAMFYECTSLVSIPLFNTSKATSMDSMFYGCTGLTEVPLLDTSRATNMSSMFYGCSKITTIPALDTSSATNMSGMFSGCAGLTEVPLLDTSSATNMIQMFMRCSSLESLPLFDTSSAITVEGMVRECTSLKHIPQFNTHNVTTFSHFAHRCYNLEDFPELDTSSATEMNRIASCCPKLTSFPLLNTHNVTDFGSMLSGHSSSYGTEYPMHLTSIPAFDYSSATSLEDAFGNNLNLETIPQINAPNVQDVSNIFMNCSNVKQGAKQLYDTFSSQQSIQTYENAFKNCGINTDTGFTELEQIPPSWGGMKPDAYTVRFEFGDSTYDPTVAGVGPNNSVWTKRDDYTANVWDWTRSTQGTSLGYYAFGSSDSNVDGAFADIENNPVTVRCTGDMSGVTNMYGMFKRCTGLYSVKHFDTSGITTTGAAYMFSRCTNCTHYPTLDLSHCNNLGYLFHYNEHLVHAPNIIMPSDSEFSATYLFSNCYLLESVPLYNLSQCTSLTSAFYCCYKLTSLPAFNTQKVTTFSSAIRETAITEMPDWDYSSATSLSYFMTKCTNATRLRPILNNNSLTNVNSAFQYCSNIEQGLYDCYTSLLNINTITNHAATFTFCGYLTEAKQTDISRIPIEWGGRQNVPAIAGNTFRFRFNSSTFDPVAQNFGKGNGTLQRCSDYTDNVWDWTLTGTLKNAFSSPSVSTYVDILESGVWSGTLDMYSAFYNFTYLASICDIDLSGATVTDIRWAFGYNRGQLSVAGTLKLPASVTNIHGLYSSANNLKNMPNIIVESSLTDVGYAFSNCNNISSGIYAMYEKLSECNPSETTACFNKCGINGPASSELDLIPTTWGGNRPVLGYTPPTEPEEQPE